MENKAYFTVKEVAQKLGVCQVTIQRAIRSKKINAFKLKGATSKWLIPSSELTRIPEMYAMEGKKNDE